jgi:hypothetical protein
MLIACQNRDVKPSEGVGEIDQKGIVKGLKIKEREMMKGVITEDLLLVKKVIMVNYPL